MPMTNEREDVAGMIADLLGSGNGTTSAPAAAPAPSPSATSAGGGAPSLADMTKVCMYSQAVPVITPERLVELEAQLPLFVEYLATLDARPLAMAQVRSVLTDALNPTVQPHESLELLASQLGAADIEVADESERLIPLIGVCIAAGGLGYTIVHNWGR